MTADHSTQLEEVMAYLDGELQGDAAERVRTHMQGCAECQRVDAELRSVSQQLASWEVGAAPMLLPTRKPYWILRRWTWMAAAASVVLVIGGGLWWNQEHRLASPQVPAAATLIGAEGKGAGGTQARPSQAAKAIAAEAIEQAGNTAQGPLIIRTARLTIVPTDFDHARRELDRIIAAAGGFVGRVVTHGDRGNPRVIEATLRIPAPKLDETLTSLRALGHVSGETREGKDVTRQSADLDSRLSNARTSETRLRQLLERRTGDLADVLAVERELARVRQEIESMEAQRKSLDQRVTYATINVTLTEERKAEVDLGPMPLPRRLRNAFVEGWTSALEVGIGTMLFVIRIVPTLLVLAVFSAPPAFFMRRWLATRGQA